MFLQISDYGTVPLNIQITFFCSSFYKKDIRYLRSKESVEVKLKEGICAELRLKLWFESDWHFYNITKSGWF